MKNPKWNRDEIILALELYFRIEHSQINSTNPVIIELSEILNKLPIHEIRPDEAKFRNANGVSLKLGNFLALDPDYDGKGLQSHSKLDKIVFEEFYSDRDSLTKIANSIKSIISNEEINVRLYNIEDDDEDLVFKEGKVLYKMHKFRERNPKINKLKKEKHLKKFGKLACEVCEFCFDEEFGELGKDYIECHHRVPLAEIKGEVETRLDDLALVCSNCHRMLHRQVNTLSIEKLKEIKTTANNK